ncbi:MAG TPA: flagellar motor protein MotB [Allosphingosinicella sp.]|nr:flagellar motor protein MotB [Allosphingosinicella sp.]
MKAVAVPRWAVSFADLILLLLGCFVLLHAMESARPKAAAVSLPVESEALQAAALFELGEARLTPSGEAALAAAARRWADRDVRIVGSGAGEGSGRLDRFELAAARTAAVARGLRATPISIEMRDASPGGQTIEIIAR